jgi:Rrf2 family protein
MYLAERPPGTVMVLGDIAVADNLPRFFLAKIFRKLTQHGLLRSSRGAIRGYALARPPTKIRVQHILEAIEGPDIAKRCPFWSQVCTDRTPCIFHERCRKPSEGMMEAVMEQTLEDLVKSSAARSRARRRSIKKLAQTRKG